MSLNFFHLLGIKTIIKNTTNFEYHCHILQYVLLDLVLYSSIFLDVLKLVWSCLDHQHHPFLSCFVDNHPCYLYRSVSKYSKSLSTFQVVQDLLKCVVLLIFNTRKFQRLNSKESWSLELFFGF